MTKVERVKVVWKFPLPLQGGSTPVVMPWGAQVLTAQLQHDTIMLWAAVDPDQRKVTRQFEVVGTGCPFREDDKKYIATVQQDCWVWHVFEVVGVIGRLVSPLV